MKDYAIFLCSVFISSVSQILLKKSAKNTYQKWWMEYVNPYVICAYGIFILSTLITIYAYKVVPLSLGPVLEASGYIFVSVMGYLFLKERIGKRKLVGLSFIMIGILIACLLSKK